MRSLKVVFLGMVAAVSLLAVPSYAVSVSDDVYSNSLDTMYALIQPYASDTPSYPSGTAYDYYAGSFGGTILSRTSDFYSAVTSGLTNGFKMLHSAMNVLRDNTSSLVTSFSTLQSYLFGSNVNHFQHLNMTGSGLVLGSTGYGQGALLSINDNLYYGFQSLFRGLGTIDGEIRTLGFDLTAAISSLQTNLGSSNSELISFLREQFDFGDHSFKDEFHWARIDLFYLFYGLLGGDAQTFNPTYTFDLSGEASLDDLSTPVDGAIPMIHRWGQIFYNMLFDPADDQLKDATEDQKNELLDEFYGDDSKGVQAGQIGSLGDVSSSAGALFDSGGNVGNVFSEIGNSGSSVWSWFSQENANAINGVGGLSVLSEDDAAAEPSLEIVDFYGAQREELFFLLGGG